MAGGLPALPLEVSHMRSFPSLRELCQHVSSCALTLVRGACLTNCLTHSGGGAWSPPSGHLCSNPV